MRALSHGPWRAIGGSRHDLPEPTLRDGADASLVIFDRRARWTVGPGSLRSRARNVPLAGRSLPGRVLLTTVRGRAAWIDPEG